MSGTGAWQTSLLNVITNGSNCQVLAPLTNGTRFFRLVSTNPPPIGLYLGSATQLLTPHELGMTDVPDMHTAILRESNTNRLWIAGRFENDTVEGATGLLLTTDFVSFASGYSPGTTNVVPVFIPSSRGSNAMPAYYTNFDADYAGADLVWRSTNGADLLMLYHGETWTFGTNAPNQQVPGGRQLGWPGRSMTASVGRIGKPSSPAATQSRTPIRRWRRFTARWSPARSSPAILSKCITRVFRRHRQPIPPSPGSKLRRARRPTTARRGRG